MCAALSCLHVSVSVHILTNNVRRAHHNINMLYVLPVRVYCMQRVGRGVCCLSSAGVFRYKNICVQYSVQISGCHMQITSNIFKIFI